MDLSNLKPAKGSVKKNKDNRKGRGEGSKKGGTSGKGNKGAQSRSGYKRKIGFEGGQMPLQRRVPKFGFKNRSRKEYVAVNLATLQELHEKSKIVSFKKQTFIEMGLISKNDLVKILGRGELTAKIEVEADGFSATATEAIEKNGGTVVKL